MRPLQLYQFIEKCEKIHKGEYSYELLTSYTNKYQKIDIICRTHGIFKQIAGNHLYHNAGCPKCGLTKRKKKENFIDLSKEKHNDKYDYSKVVYISMKKKVEIVCKKHGSFLQTPLTHLRGSGCYECGIEKMSYKLTKPLNEFIEKCKDIHGNEYDYSKINYSKLSDKIIIICKKHGEFEQRAFSHQQGYGCNKCNKSKGEKKIESFLEKMSIDFETNKHFETCKNKNTLPFDFYLPQNKICIEYDGIQHHEVIPFFGGIEKLKYQKKLDSIKNRWCKKNGINLLRLNYKNYSILENILSDFLYKHKIIKSQK